MTWINYDDVLSQLQGAGFDLADLVVGERKRCKVVDVAQKGWYALHEITLDDGRHALVGAFGWWIGAEKFVENVKLRVDKQAVKLSAEQHAAVKARVAEEKRKAEAARAALAPTCRYRPRSSHCRARSATMEELATFGRLLFGRPPAVARDRYDDQTAFKRRSLAR